MSIAMTFDNTNVSRLIFRLIIQIVIVFVYKNNIHHQKCSIGSLIPASFVTLHLFEFFTAKTPNFQMQKSDLNGMNMIMDCKTQFNNLTICN